MVLLSPIRAEDHPQSKYSAVCLRDVALGGCLSCGRIIDSDACPWGLGGGRIATSGDLIKFILLLYTLPIG